MAQVLRTFDPILLEVLWTRLISIVEESESTLVRTSFSSTVGEADDHAACLLDARGQIMAQSPKGLPGFVGILGRTARLLLERFPADALQPGDTLITNDPWICAGHLNDINLLRPIFFQGKVVAFASNIAHLSDVGGRGSAEGVDLFEEGLRIPPTFLYRGGKLQEDVLGFIRANSRTPRLIVGDIGAQMAANLVMERRVIETMEEYGLDDLAPLSDTIQARTEEAMRALIDKLPDGEYAGEAISDGYDEPVAVRVKVIIRGSDVTVDYAGSSPQIARALNCPYGLTYASSVFPFRCLAPTIPMSEGAIRPITVIAPEGSVVNPRFPAPVQNRTVIIHNAHAAIFQALSRLVPEHIPPERIIAHSGCIWAFRLRGAWDPDPAFYKNEVRPIEERFVQLYLFNGGQGAQGTRDGRSTFSMPENCANVPIEVMERRAPIVYLKKEFVTDSGGAGTFRGGLGQRIDLAVLNRTPILFISSSVDRMYHPPFGLLGGQAGGAGQVLVDGQPIHPRTVRPLATGQVLTLVAPGGGGVGDPRKRDPARVRADVAAGLVSPAAARDVYGRSD